MKFYTWYSEKINGKEYIAWYDDEYILTIDYMDDELDTYNVLEADDFSAYELTKCKKFSDSINILFLKFLFTIGFNGGSLSDIT